MPAPVIHDADVGRRRVDDMGWRSGTRVCVRVRVRVTHRRTRTHERFFKNRAWGAREIVYLCFVYYSIV